MESLKQLAAYTFSFPADNALITFEDTLVHIARLERQRKIEILINQLKQSDLSREKKERLQTLLGQQKKLNSASETS